MLRTTVFDGAEIRCRVALNSDGVGKREVFLPRKKRRYGEFKKKKTKLTREKRIEQDMEN